MKELIRYNKYSRKDVHDIFAPNTKFSKGAGIWGMSGIIRIPGTLHDYIFLVTYGRQQSDHKFEEDIDENGILTWQSQPSQKLSDPQILDFIKHDYTKNNIYLFLRKNSKEDYTYLGLIAYVSHDNQREKPVYFKWQILDLDEEKDRKELNDLGLAKLDNYDNIDKKFKLTLKNDEETYYINQERKGRKTKEFYSNRDMDFEGELRKNTKLGNKGEDIVVDYEKDELILKGRKDLADKVFATRKQKGNAERFDVFSYDENGKEKYIEVKSTKGKLSNRFHISENEVQFSHEYADKYYLYRVYNLNPKTMTANLKIIKGPIDRDKLEATNYTCRIGGNNENI